MTTPNLLVDALPNSVEIDGREYEIRSDFRTGVLFELLIQDDEISEPEKFGIALSMYYPEIPEDRVAALEQIIWFYGCGRRQDDKRRTGDDDGDGAAEEKRPVYSFEHDDAYIYASFLKEYGIDLTEVDMHWWKFRALFRALPEDAMISKIMGYRAAKITDKMSKTEKQYLRKMKKLYALPLSEKAQKAQSALLEALQNGGDLTGLI